ncbi:MAG TPA: hypothetical protein VEI50_00085 [Nitrospiraceae bacterium]|nr:hypothetical protein [Nitrospiraceae bacterium]
MLQQATIGDQILELVRVHPDCTLEEVTQHFPELHWYDVYIEMERLSRLGHLRLIHKSVLSTITSRLP